MDLLKQEIMKKKQDLAKETGGKRFFKRSEIEQKRLQKLREEEKREVEEKSKRQQQESSSSSTASLLDLIYSTKPNADSSTKTTTLTTEEQNNIDELNLSKQEVIRRLRFLKQPITLFGEDDLARLDRLKYVLKTGIFEVDSDMTEGQTNDFLRDIIELKKRQKTGMLSDRKRKSEDLEDGEGGKGDDELSGDGGSGFDADKDIALMKARFEDLCEEDKILVFFKKLLNEWRQELDEMQDLNRRTAKGKQMVATFKQCARYLSPLFKFCRKRALPDDIKASLMFIVDCCGKRDYRTAVDHYIKLAIGNAPWPIGVTMVGIHERSAREKIYTNSVAHVMNDETTRKYLQSVKRLVTFCQRKYPTVPSKSIEFNSLANGSDLQALLMDEHHAAGGGNQVQEEMLQLPAPRDE
ncbi:unnamed protein product [Amaranthus hypochondriacus]